VLKRPLKHCRGALALWYGLQGGVGPPRNSKNRAKNHAKTHPECLKTGEISIEGRIRLKDDEQPGIAWENDLKYKMEQCIYP
jgi:hypothetical protein